MDDTHRPHLAPDEIETLYNRVGEAIKGDLVRAARIVGPIRLQANPLIPIVAIPIQFTDSMTLDPHIVARNLKCS